jgi:hypothetical protein
MRKLSFTLLLLLSLLFFVVLYASAGPIGGWGSGDGTPAADPCVNDDTAECTLNATRSTSDANFTAANIRTATNILNVTGTLVEADATCSNDVSTQCTLPATRSSGDAQFTAGNIASGVNILNVTGTYGPACTADDTATCLLNSTRSTSDADFTAANIKNATNILNVTGTYDPQTVYNAVETTPFDVTTTSVPQALLTGAAHTKGDYTELLAATSFRAINIECTIGPAAAANNYFYDISTGTAGNEVVLLPNLWISSGTATGFTSVVIPIEVPAGVRLSARAQATGAAAAPRILCHLYGTADANVHRYTRMTAYGLTTATTVGTTVDPGAVANTKGAYAQVTASTANPISAFYLVVNNRLNQDETSMNMRYDVATGVALSEVVLQPDVQVTKSSFSDNLAQHWYGPYYWTIAQGTRLAVRAQSTQTDATDRLNDVAIYGLD